MRSQTTFRKTNFAASTFCNWVSKAFNRKAEVKSLSALALAPLVALLIIVSAMNASVWFAKPALIKRQVLSAAQDGPTESSPEAILITLQPYGFEPSEVTLKAGPLLLAVDNRSGLDEPIFRVDRVAGGRLHEVRMAKGKLAWRQLVDLPPGDYVLTEAAHPDWVCQITITPR
jgi:hypothetical protein